VHSILLYILLAFGLAMAFSVGTAFTAEYFDPTIRTPGEACSLLEVPVLAWLPAPDPAVPRPSIFRIGRSKEVVQ
jgi:capsular polysaccharide biosynthesis protein